MRKNLLLGLVGLLVGGALFGLVSVIFRAELHGITEWIFQNVGLGGVFVLLFFADVVASPIPTGSFLLLITATRFPHDWASLVPAIGLVSAFAGYVAFFGGRWLSDSPLSTRLFEEFRRKREDSIRKAAPVAVALGALTPIPFALTCWTAGLLRVPFSRIWAPCLLRVLRYLVLYFALVYSERFFEMAL